MKTIRTFTAGLLAIALLLSACGGGGANATPTFSLDTLQTNAVATFSSAFTMTALFSSPQTRTPTATMGSFLTIPSPTLSTLAASGSVPTASCYRLTYVADVTVPDDTQMTPGQVFTKTWKVRNTGSCAWDAGFQFAFTSGDAMSGTGYTLTQSVPPNAETNISVDMLVPNKTGTVKGNWRMSTASGVFFGEEIYVQIVVGSSTGTPATATQIQAATTITATPSITPTSTALPSETPTETTVP